MRKAVAVAFPKNKEVEYDWGHPMKYDWETLEKSVGKRIHYRRLAALLEQNVAPGAYGSVIRELEKVMEEAAVIRHNRLMIQKHFWPWTELVTCTEIEIDGKLWPCPLPVFHHFLFGKQKPQRKKIAEDDAPLPRRMPKKEQRGLFDEV